MGTYDPGNLDALVDLVGPGDVVVSPVLTVNAMRRGRSRAKAWVFDLYDPEPLENLERLARAPGLQSRVRAALLQDRFNAALLIGDAFICGTERQRDLWLGALMTLRRATASEYQRDPSLRSLIDVVPFGLPSTPPCAGSAPVMKGRWSGIDPADRVVLWTGGIWDWLDPLTVIRAVDRLKDEEPTIRLVFLGTGRPGGQPTMAMERSARSLADHLGLTGVHVFFNRDWVPYESRSAYLLEADVGVSAHLDHVEARLSCRTRLLDHIWAGLPTVATEGDAISDEITRTGAGRIVPCEDADAFADALTEVLAAGRDTYAESFGALRRRFEWPAAVRPLARLVENLPAKRSPRRRGALLAHDLRARTANVAKRLRGGDEN